MLITIVGRRKKLQVLDGLKSHKNELKNIMNSISHNATKQADTP